MTQSGDSSGRARRTIRRTANAAHASEMAIHRTTVAQMLSSIATPLMPRIAAITLGDVGMEFVTCVVRPAC